MNKILKLIYIANHRGIKLWVENDILKYRQDLKDMNEDHKDLFESLAIYKREIIEILKLNEIYSSNFSLPYIYSTGGNIYPLSCAQERLWFIEQFEKGTNAYHIPVLLNVKNDTNLNVFKKCIHEIINRHEILRSVIRRDQAGNEFQEVLKINDNYLDEDSFNSKKTLFSHLNDVVNKPFDLSNNFPIRLGLYALQSREIYCLILIHHIASDGWSVDILAKEIEAYYIHYTTGQPLHSLGIEQLPIQYGNYAAWQKQQLSSSELSRQLKYWEDMLEGYETLKLPTDKKRSLKRSNKGDSLTFQFGTNLSQRLRALAKKEQISLYTLMLSGFYLLLAKYSGQKDIIVGSPIANRNNLNTANLIGFFINSLPLRLKLGGISTIKDLLSKVGKLSNDLIKYQSLPFDLLVSKMNIEKDNLNPIFQVIFTVQGFDKLDESKIFNVDRRWSDFYKVVKFDLDVYVNDSYEDLSGTIDFSTSLYNKSTIERFATHYIRILEQLDIIAYLSEIKLLNYDEHNYFVYKLNKNNECYYRYKNVIEAFEDQCKKSPMNVAVVYNGVQLTYSELNNQANQLSRYIEKVYHKVTRKEISFDTLICISVERSLEMLIGIIGILKTGAAYVPIDPEYPPERIKLIIEDSESKLLLTQSQLTGLSKTIHEIGIEALCLDKYDYFLEEPLSVNKKICSNSLAYVIYTSGTTGTPKGVMVEHKSVVGFCHKNNFLLANAELTFIGYSNFAFDGSVFDFFYSLLNGSKLVIVNKLQILDANELAKVIELYSADTLFLTPSLFNRYNELGIRNPLLKLKNILVGGEKADPGAFSSFIKLKPSFLKLINVYGPTENIVFSTFCEITESNYKTSPIGKKLTDKTVYLLDQYLNPVDVGMVGELYIGGKSQARGYLNRPDLTAEKFIPNPFVTDAERDKNYNIKLYKTGDICRFSESMDLIYLNRADTQIKIRGYRIEIDEIQEAIQSFPYIEKAIVLAKKLENSKNDEHRESLIAYYTLKREISDVSAKKFINLWQDVYQENYTKLNILDQNCDFIGWNSSLTGMPIPFADMQEWVNCSLVNIQKIVKNNILEIGSGSGLLMFGLLASCQNYIAVDFSLSAISHIEQKAKKLNMSNKVSTYVCAADAVPFEDIKDKFDTVILNSIIQYFPNIDYLENILVNLIANITDEGKIYLGDIRDKRLHKFFYYSVLTYKHQKATSDEIEQFISTEKELLISPNYFINLKFKFNNIVNIDLMPKLGEAEDEMNFFRYDVIIHIRKNAVAVAKDKKEIVFEKLTSLESLSYSENIYFSYPNKRIYHAYSNYMDANHEQSYQSTIDSLLSPSQLISFGVANGYKVKLFLDNNKPEQLLIAYYNSANEIYSDDIFTKKSTERTSNNPLLNKDNLANNFNEDLKAFLAQKVPSYMIPVQFIHLDEFPLSSNGKIAINLLPDVKILPALNYVAPISETEKMVCNIWADMLNLHGVGMSDDFFRIGGNSILAIKLSHLMSQKLSRKVDLKTIFAGKTIQAILKLVNDSDENQYNTIRIIDKNYNAPLSYAQERLWFIEQFENGTNAYHIPLFLKINPETSLDCFKSAIHSVIERQEILRTVFHKDKGYNDYQKILEINTNYLQEEIFLDKTDMLKCLEIAINSPFNLREEFPIRVGIYSLTSGDIYCLILIHHVASDGWSIDIFAREVEAFYTYHTTGKNLGTLYSN